MYRKGSLHQKHTFVITLYQVPQIMEYRCSHFYAGTLKENAENRWDVESSLNSIPLQRYG
jgi:hypothetical protein